MRGCIILLLAVFAAVGSHAAPFPPSASKISVHLLISYSPGAAQIIQAHPRVIKILDTSGAMLQAARDYKASTPDGKIVCRIYTSQRWNVTDNPAAAGTNFWQTVLAPALVNLSAADKALIDYVEGPNEGDSTPTWGSAADTQWYNTFWMHLAPLIANAGFKPLAYSISVGNPPGSLAEIQASLDRIVPSLRLCQSLGGGWSYHSYSLPYSTNLTDEIWYSVRYRQYYSYFASRYPDLVNLPLVLTEGGIDGAGPWSTRGDTNKFQNWLAWFDSEIRKDAYCLGVTLFQIGETGGWNGFNVEPVAPWIANYLLANSGSTNSPRLTLAVLNNPSNIALTLSDPANTASGANRANYWLRRASDGVRVQAISATLAFGTNVTLITPPLTPFTDYTLTVSNVGAAGIAGATPGWNGTTNVLAPLRLVGIDDITRWSYNASGANLGSAWRATNYNDAAWSSGNALLGFESTPLTEPIRSPMAASSVLTYYFRTRFHWPYTNTNALLRLRYLVDDGAVFYLNVREAYRIGISNNPVFWTNVASRTVSDAAYEGPILFNVNYLIYGTNVFAAEVHQVNSTSTDMIFGAELEALVPPSALAEARPILLHRAWPQPVLSWSNSSFALESATSLTGPWTRTSPQNNPYVIGTSNALRLYRLRQ
jgi:hypothetical protein